MQNTERPQIFAFINHYSLVPNDSVPGGLLGNLQRDYKAIGTHMVVVLYVDSLHGVCLKIGLFCEFLEDGSLRKSGEANAPKWTTTLRYGLFDNFTFLPLSVEQLAMLGLPSKIEWLRFYQEGFEEVEPLRELAFLDPLRSRQFPDDIQFYVLPTEPYGQQEYIWGRLLRRHNATLFECRLLNQPHQNCGLNMGDHVLVSVRQLARGLSAIAVGPIANVDIFLAARSGAAAYSWRTDAALEGRFRIQHPDDLLVLVHDGGPRVTDRPPELMWVRVTERQGRAYAGTLLNAPHRLQSVRQGTKILFLAPTVARFPPVHVTDAYLAEREHWIISPCTKCGFDELFDPPSQFIPKAFPKLPNATVMGAFTSFCPVCRGGQLLVTRAEQAGVVNKQPGQMASLGGRKRKTKNRKAMKAGSAEKQRGGCLTAWIMLVLIANPLVAIFYLLSGNELARSLPGFPGWAIPGLIVIAVANTVFAVGTWIWKRWGVYGFAASAVITFAVNLFAGLGGPSFGAFVPIAILWALVRNIWQQFD